MTIIGVFLPLEWITKEMIIQHDGFETDKWSNVEYGFYSVETGGGTNVDVKEELND